MRNVQKALLNALLLPHNTLKNLQEESKFTDLMFMQEEMKTAPFGDIWAEFLKRENKAVNYLTEIKKYEEQVLVNR